MGNQFSSARFKVIRAIRHINELQTLLASDLQDPDRYRVFVDEDLKTGAQYLGIDVIKPLSPAYPLTIGDAIHDLTGAFDHMASAMARHETRDGPRVHFPFHQTRERLIESGPYRAIERTRPDIASKISDVLQPYEGGNGDALWKLNKLDNIDKHRLLVPVVRAVSFVGVRAENESGTIVIGDNVLGIERDGRARLIGIGGAATGPLKITDHGKAALDVFFAEGQFFERESVIPTLQRLAELVRGAIEMLEGAYFG